MEVDLGGTNRAENRFSHTRWPEFIAPGRDEWQSGKVTWQSTLAPENNLPEAPSYLAGGYHSMDE
jgi:hypothetical protein